MRRHIRRAAVAALLTSGAWFLVVYLMVCGFAEEVE